jgi:Flp pilus assembly protein TadG
MKLEAGTDQAQRRLGADAMPITRAVLIRLKTMLAASDGVAAVEFAVFVPVLLALLVPLCDLGMGLSAKLQVWEAAQAGAQYALANGFASSAIENAVTGATSLSSISASPAPAESCGCPTGSAVAAANPAVPPCTGTCPGGELSGTYVTVTATAVYYPLIPYPALGSSVTLTATSFVRIQ